MSIDSRADDAPPLDRRFFDDNVQTAAQALIGGLSFHELR